MLATPEVHSFQAETSNLLDLMIHSLYTNKEVFLRELISNASDALDHLRFEALTNPDVLEGDDRYEIRLHIDESARILTVSDTGIGMSRDEVLRNIGTIALSGTRELREKLSQEGAQQALTQMIGQFGVGFYSAFMVAERVVLVTRRAGERVATRWESVGDGSFSICDAEKESRGTEIALYLRPEDRDNGIANFTDPWKLAEVVKKYSDFINYPIRFREVREETPSDNLGMPLPGAKSSIVEEDRVLNSMKPLWTLPRSEVQESDYIEFYRRLCHDQEAPMKTLVLKAEGLHEYQVLLFIPAKAPSDLYYHAPDVGLRLFANRVMIVDKCPELLPRYLRFVRGVVDTADMPLNISRQRLQQDAHIGKIREWLTKKILEALTEMARSDNDQYLAFWHEFGRALKEGIGADYSNRDRILPLLLFASSDHASRLTTLEAYVSRMKPDQKDILYISGESRQLLERSPHLEAIRAKEYEVLFLTDPVDELMLQYLTEFQGKRLKSAAKGVTRIDASEEEKAALKNQEQNYGPLMSFLKDILKEDVKRVQLSTRLTKSPACLVVDDFENSPWMDRMLLKGKGGGPKQKRVLEVNPNHPVVVRMNERLLANLTDSLLPSSAHLLFGMALLTEGSELTEPVVFTEAVTQLLEQTIK